MPPPTPETHVHIVMNAPGGTHSKLSSGGIQVGDLPIDFTVFVDTLGDYTLSAVLRDPTGRTIENIYSSPFHVNAGDTAGKSIHVGPLKPGAGSRQTDLFLTVAGTSGNRHLSHVVLPIISWK